MPGLRSSGSWRSRELRVEKAEPGWSESDVRGERGVLRMSCCSTASADMSSKVGVSDSA